MKNKMITRQFTSSQPSPLMANTISRIIREYEKQEPCSTAKKGAASGSGKTNTAQGRNREPKPTHAI